MSTPHTAPRIAQSGGDEESRIHGGEGVDYSRPGLVGYLTFPPQGAVNLRDAAAAGALAVNADRMSSALQVPTVAIASRSADAVAANLSHAKNAPYVLETQRH